MLIEPQAEPSLSDQSGTRSGSGPLRLFLHIGVHKTGTTSIQRRFHRHASKLRAVGVLYPKGRFQKYPTQHSALVGLIKTRQPRKLLDFLDAVHAEAAASHCRIVVLSGEELSLISEKQLRALHSAVVRTGFDPVVVVFFRNPLDHLRSTVNHLLRNGPYLTPARLAASLPRIDPEAIVRRFAAVFGSERIIRHDLSSRDDAVAIFDQDVGIDLHLENVRRNTRMDFATLSWMNILNAELGLSRKQIQDAYRATFMGRDFPVAAEAAFLQDVADAIGGDAGKRLKTSLRSPERKAAAATRKQEKVLYLENLARFATALSKTVQGQPPEGAIPKLVRRGRKMLRRLGARAGLG